MNQWAIIADDAQKTLAAFLRTQLPDQSWNQVRALCAQGRVFVNEHIATDSALRLQAGDLVEVRSQGHGRRAGVLPKEDIVYCDRDVVVVRKTNGVLTVPFDNNDKDTLVDLTRAALRKMEPSRKGKHYDPMLGVVHRIDKETSGLVMFTRTLAAKKHLQQQFREHSVHRRYHALAHGHVLAFTAETWLIADRGDGLRGSWERSRFRHRPKPDEARRSVTHISTLRVMNDATLIECRLETGRQHQIRIHLSEAGHPLIGERVYIRDFDAPLLPASRLMLHARELGFIHPRTGKLLSFSDPVPPEFDAWAKGHDKKDPRRRS